MSAVDANSGDDGPASSKTTSDHENGPVIGRPARPSDNGDRMNPGAKPQGGYASEPVARDVTVSAGALGPADAGAARASGDTVAAPATPAGPAGAGPEYVIDDTLEDVPNSSPLPASAIEVFGLSSAEAEMLLEEAREYLSDDAKGRQARMNTTPSDRTCALYRKKVRNLVETYYANHQPTGHQTMDLMLPYAKSRQTFKVMRAALKWHLKRRIEFRVAELNAAALKETPLPMSSCIRLYRTLALVLSLDKLSFQDCLDYLQTDERPARAGRKTLHELKPEERARFLREAERSPTYCLAGTILNYCGLRPVELEKGVTLKWLGDGLIDVTILGAKVREGVAGQLWRRMQLKANKVPGWFANHVQSVNEVKVTAESDAMRKYLERLGPFVLHPSRRDANLTAYAFRHALVTDLRDNGWSAEEIAVVIGELSAATVATYGRRRGRGKVRPVAIERSSIKSECEVKPLDRNRLAAVLRKTAWTRAKTARR